MADLSTGRPAFLDSLPTDQESALKVLKRTHAEYAAYQQTWEVLIHAFEGTGGFLDGSYLFEFPREDTADYNRRKEQARYHNYLESLVDLFVRFIWTQGVSRESSNLDYNAWLDRVDGQNQRMDELMKRLAAFGLVNGHAGCLIDKTPEPAAGQAKADEAAQVIAAVFSALAIPDWRFNATGLQAIKLIEAAPTVGILEEAPDAEDAAQFLVWDTTGWARFDADGHLLAWGTPDLGVVPFVVLRPKPAQTSDMCGRALVSNANVIRAMFNRDSEEDLVLRCQAFSVLTVEVPPEGDVQETKDSLGGILGTSKALVVKGAIKYETPDQSVPKAIRDNKAYLVQEMYRAAHVRFQRDGLQRESGEALAQQNAAMTEILQGLSKSLAAAERDIARAWFAWMFPTPEAAQAAYDAAKVTIKYPDKFFLAPLLEDLEAWAEGLRMDLGETATKTIKKRAVRRILGDVPTDDLEQIDQEIDAQKAGDVLASGALDLGDPEGQAITREAAN